MKNVEKRKVRSHNKVS